MFQQNKYVLCVVNKSSSIIQKDTQQMKGKNNFL